MRLVEIGAGEVAARLCRSGLVLEFGPICALVRSDVAGLAEAMRVVYGQFPVVERDGLFDITVDITRVSGIRRYFASQIEFRVDGETPFEPFPADTHLPLLEWGLNWCLANRLHSLLLLHAGTLERGGCGLLLPALPGSGKSTFVAAMNSRGFRLLSDEFGAVDVNKSELLPIVRPIALKNESIGILRDFAPGSEIGPSFPRTRKGTVAHVAPDRASVDRRGDKVQAAHIVFPRFEAGRRTTIEAVPKARAFVKLIANSFNYDLLGVCGFNAAKRLIDECDCWSLTYGDLANAVQTVDSLISSSERSIRSEPDRQVVIA